MKVRMTFAIAVGALVLGVPVAAATLDDHPQQGRQADTSDVLSRYVRNNAPKGSQPYLQHSGDPSDVITRYLRRERPATSAAGHPDSLRARPTVPGSVTVASADNSFGWDEFGAGIAGGFALGVVGVSVALLARGRRWLANP